MQNIVSKKIKLAMIEQEITNLNNQLLSIAKEEYRATEEYHHSARQLEKIRDIESKIATNLKAYQKDKQQLEEKREQAKRNYFFARDKRTSVEKNINIKKTKVMRLKYELDKEESAKDDVVTQVIKTTMEQIIKFGWSKSNDESDSKDSQVKTRSKTIGSNSKNRRTSSSKE